MKDIISKYLKDHGFGEFNPKAVLFDMDGVLYDSMPNHAVAWQESMKQFDIHMTASDAYATEGARGIDTIQMMVKKQKGIDISLDEAQKMYDVKTEIFHTMPTAQIFPGVKDIMQKIKNAGMQVGVVTGSGQRPLILRLLDDFGDFLDESHIVTAYRPLSHGTSEGRKPETLAGHRGGECALGRSCWCCCQYLHRGHQLGTSSRRRALPSRLQPALSQDDRVLQ